MAKVRRVLFKTTFFQGGIPKYEKGRHYAASIEAENAVIVSGDAEFVDIEMDAEQAAQELTAAEREWAQKNRQTVAVDPEFRKRFGKYL